MSWNYRVMRTTVTTPAFDHLGEHFEEAENEFVYSIRECYYKNESDKLPDRWTDPITVTSESVDGIQWVLDKMKVALTKPALTIEDGKMVEIEQGEHHACTAKHS